MNGLDWVMLVVAGLFVIGGLWKGLIRLVFAVVAVVAAVLLACLATGPGTGMLSGFIENRAAAAVVSFIVVFVVVLVLLAIVAAALSRAVHVLGLGWIDRAGGAVLGLAGALLVLGALFLVLDLAGYGGRDFVRNARLAPVGRAVAGILDDAFPEDIREMMEKRRDDFRRMEEWMEEGREKMQEVPEKAREYLPEEV